MAVDLRQELASAGVQLVGARQSLDLILRALDEQTTPQTPTEMDIRRMAEERIAKLDAAEAAVRAVVQEGGPQRDTADTQQYATTAFVRSLANLADAVTRAIDAEYADAKKGAE